MVAVQTGDAFSLHQIHRLSGAGAQIHLISERDDPVRMMFLDIAQHGFKGDDVAVHICDEGNTHVGLRISFV